VLARATKLSVLQIGVVDVADLRALSSLPKLQVGCYWGR
jgi:hypothetical protein